MSTSITPNLAPKMAAIAVMGLCLIAAACNKKGEETVTSGSEYSGQFPSASAGEDSGAPQEVPNSALPAMNPAVSASSTS